MTTLVDLWKKEAVDDMSNRRRVIRDSLVELVATTIFVYTGTLSVVSTGRKLVGQGGVEDVARILPIAMSFGVSIMALVYSIGHLSGGHMNPGVSLTAYFRRRMSGQKMICYWLAQFLGAIIGSSLMWGSTSELAGLSKANDSEVLRPPFDLGATVLDEGLSQGNGFLLEFIGSFFFYFVIAQTALDERGIGGTSFPAIPIGFILVIVHVCLIPFTGCGVNPARTFGPSMVVCMVGDRCDEVVTSSYWIYWIGPFAASLVVAEVTTWLQMDVDDTDTKVAEKKLSEDNLEIEQEETAEVASP